MRSFSETIIQKATELGFDMAGVVSAEMMAGESKKLHEWLERGYHGNMSWMARDPEMRNDPRRLYPEARSIVVVALNYYTDHRHTPSAGKISRYAWGDDYHDVLREKLRLLLDWIKTEKTGADGKICVDTTPFMDKAWAVRAGLGWLGKHTNLITKELGSWVFIGSVILNIELEPTAKMVEDHCGTCTMCIDACPTGAIVEPYVVDSRKCISYATIELRDETLPEDIVENLDGWIYGCDICQDVCPWNRFEKPTSESRFEPRRGDTSLEPSKIMEMTHHEYVDRFRRSAIKRTKLSGLKRNAAALTYDPDHVNQSDK